MAYFRSAIFITILASFTLLGAVEKLRKAAVSFVSSICLSICPHGKIRSHRTDFNKIWCFSIFRKSVEKIHFSLKSDKNNGYFTWRQTYIFIISRSVLLRKKNVSDKSCRDGQNPRLCSISFFFSKIVPLKRTWKNSVERGKPLMTMWRMRIAWCIPRATNIFIFHCNNGWMNAHCYVICPFFTWSENLTLYRVLRLHLRPVNSLIHCRVCGFLWGVCDWMWLAGTES
jgi:hypothetical protein